MPLIWNELKPLDRFRVRVHHSLSPLHMRTLTHLYQPIMGALSYSLYLTLVYEVDGERFFSVQRSHQWLMSALKSTLDELWAARLRLEALGLLKTFKLEKDSNESFFEYELLPPLLPHTFFHDDVLSICLYNQIGTQRYRELRQKYSSYFVDGTTSDMTEERSEVTREFHEVFTSVSPSELVALQGSELEHELREIDLQYPLPQCTEQGPVPQFERFQLDTQTLQSFLMKGLQVERIINRQTLPVLKKIAYFYQLDEWTLSRLIHDSLNVDDELELNVLREKAKEWYRLQEGGKPPKVVQLRQPTHKKVIKREEVLSEADLHLLQLENMTPIQLLEKYQNGGKVADADLKLVEELLVDYQLYPSVVNLLVEYVYLTNDFKLPRSLVTKIAAHWKRLKIDDIRKAQEVAKKEHEQYKNWREGKQKGSNTRRKSTQRSSTTRKDKLPKWIVEQEEQERQQNGSRNNSSETVEAKKKRIEQLLKDLGEWKGEGKES